MTFKKLAIALAVVFMSSLSPMAPVASFAPVQVAMAQEAAAPTDATKNAAAAQVAAANESTPYGLSNIWTKGTWISKAILIVLGFMSAGTWYIFFTKWIDQQRILGQANAVEKKFWTSATLSEGVEKLPKTSVFRGIAEAGLKASSGGTTLVGLNDWIGMSLTRQLEDANARLQGGVAFLGSVGSVSPFVGLLGTVMGILNALIGIGVAGQASIDKVAGPVGEALIMTALGLAVAVPAVLLYNYLVRRNKVITEKLRAFAGDLQAYLISKSK
ncbi:MAG TPA: MotA/TolQ/ExbB proton channel family protein [Candidatus Saccharimonadales bacterium]|jgi:biopolymer transport protein ExbB|nr:MotA/TolQ/ExbB proton channel family protein [Candidatus Saccharimonadales bacterium]